MADAVVHEPMSCRCVTEQWQRERDRQAQLARKTAVLLDRPQVLYRTVDGKYGFVSEGAEIKGEIIEIITQY